jgi:hypothetical protein
VIARPNSATEREDRSNLSPVTSEGPPNPRGKDDLSRVVSLYGLPDFDRPRLSAPSRESRDLEYRAANVVFTFIAESQWHNEMHCVRWKLLVITDTVSQNSLTASAAADRFIRKRR